MIRMGVHDRKNTQGQRRISMKDARAKDITSPSNGMKVSYIIEAYDAFLAGDLMQLRAVIRKTKVRDATVPFSRFIRKNETAEIMELMYEKLVINLELPATDLNDLDVTARATANRENSDRTRFLRAFNAPQRWLLDEDHNNIAILEPNQQQVSTVPNIPEFAHWQRLIDTITALPQGYIGPANTACTQYELRRVKEFIFEPSVGGQRGALVLSPTSFASPGFGALSFDLPLHKLNRKTNGSM